MTRGSVAKNVRESKERHPERFCSAKGCLWAVRSGKCPKHPYAAIHMGRVVVDNGGNELLPEELRGGEDYIEQARRLR